MLTLAIDSSGQSLSLALFEADQVVSEFMTNTRIQHSKQLLPLLDLMCETVNVKPQEIDQILVVRGPGSYTGLRIGVTVAKMLACTLAKPLYSLSSLQALAGQVTDPINSLIVPFFNARRQTVYAAAYAKQADGQLDEVVAAGHYQMTDFLQKLSTLAVKPHFISPDYANFADLITQNFTEASYSVQKPAFSLISTARLAELTWQAEDPHTFTPQYYKLAEAEENWQADHPDLAQQAGADFVERTD
ncbi:hypothetical protein AWM75_05030 [Aerococcus urinaehominis]|uniref:Uncharacterized protein n=1 Tax=Aerococcus urinaehominis TaxID=128944 RepID=A0A0X8FLQ2_9LACT|nr:tRNA (adenosine(37)-N6)-threonylcarbamoyltransferase complex dimerization subunit type 1 TsaB [Aerococcus urinaehominis]AMB99394.1 hypothetical protein AWM75_05030 [Aerococcus urinaehominis]SDM23669.1 tRNA threonylcarbamoyladenosine biosynthesis protein TsaB [Aerococcus urinaehominis]